jgi:hypothetical protein
LDARLEALQLPRRDVRADVVNTWRKCDAERLTEAPLDRLWSRLNHKKGLLLVVITSFRAVPITVVRQLSPTLAGESPVGDFMERTAQIVSAKIDAMR